MSVRCTLGIEDGPELAAAAGRVAGRDLTERAERLGARATRRRAVSSTGEQVPGTGRAVAYAPFMKVSPPGAADVFGWFPDSLCRRAL